MPVAPQSHEVDVAAPARKVYDTVLLEFLPTRAASFHSIVPNEQRLTVAAKLGNGAGLAEYQFVCRDAGGRTALNVTIGFPNMGGLVSMFGKKKAMEAVVGTANAVKQMAEAHPA